MSKSYSSVVDGNVWINTSKINEIWFWQQAWAYGAVYGYLAARAP